MEPSPSADELANRIRREVPAAPGVYLFRDRFGAIIYVGKSVNLKRRMAGYFGRNRSRHEGRMKRMVHSIQDFTYRTTDSDLSALLVEDELIKRHLPFFNRRQKKFGNYRYLELTDDPFPCLRVVEEPGGIDRARLFGPFPDLHFIGRLRSLIQRCFSLRDCTEAAPSRRCLNLQIARCEGPCQGLIEPGEYGRNVKEVEAFLKGDANQAKEKLREDMARAAGALDFEQAARCMESLGFCDRFTRRQRFTHRFRFERLTIREKGQAEAAYLFEDGRRIRPPNDDGSGEAAPIEDDRFLLDRAHIVYHWLGRNRERFEHHFE
jgi:excinuclease ABC subunit C